MALTAAVSHFVAHRCEACAANRGSLQHRSKGNHRSALFASTARFRDFHMGGNRGCMTLGTSKAHVWQAPAVHFGRRAMTSALRNRLLIRIERMLLTCPL